MKYIHLIAPGIVPTLSATGFVLFVYLGPHESACPGGLNAVHHLSNSAGACTAAPTRKSTI